MVLSMAPLNSFGPSDQNEVQYDIFGHVTPLAPELVACDADVLSMAPLHS